MKIFFTANVLWDIYIFRGGVIKALVEAGHDVTVVAPHETRIDIGKELGVKVINIHLNKRGMNPIEDFKLFLELYKIYKKEKPDIIFHYTIKANIYGTLASHFSKIKSIAVLTGLGYAFVTNSIVSKIAKLLYKFSLPFADEVCVLNEDDKNLLVNEKIVKENKVFVLPSEGVDTEKFSPMEKTLNLNNEKIIFLMIARAFFDKGVKEYVESAEIIRAMYPNSEFQFLGALGGNSVSGVDETQMKSFVDKGIINYLGTVNDVREIIKNADCIVLPSYREGISRTLLEGASMEKPLIATNVTGCKEIVIDNVSGFLVEPKNSKDLADKIKKFIELSEDEKIAFGKNGRKHILNTFDEKIVIDIYKNRWCNL
ncbi:glycosyltransferase family 4 protein [Fusobacterium sp.]|uniref:glycosyltransferase family 4 protein n=1 Tax=Fusobacterium sp. TaxID=68766 RepID=UPI00260AD4BF|nr:glycosyltransferase family 4 protein [Fusobacterium sp.]